MRVTKVLTDDRKFVAVELTAEFGELCYREVGFSSCNFDEGDKFSHSVGYKLALLRAMDKIGKRIHKGLPGDVKETSPFGPPPVVEARQEPDFILEKDYIIINISNHSKATIFRTFDDDGLEVFNVVIITGSHTDVYNVATIDEAMKTIYSYV